MLILFANPPSPQVESEFAENFFVGMLPDAMTKVADDSWDVVVCNSVFQYLATEEQAKQAVTEMIRVAKRWVEGRLKNSDDED